MYKCRQVWQAAISNFRRWRNNPRIFLTFSMAFIVSFMMSDKVIQFAKAHDTVLQAAEPFIWTFGDSQSVLIMSLLLLLLFADLPNLGNDVPFFLVRINRRIWMLGQILYIIMATLIFVLFVLASTFILSFSLIYVGNMWSETAAILGYSQIGRQIAVPAFVKVLELSFPYECMLHVFGLMLGYSVLMSSIILFFNMCRDNGGMIGGVLFSAFGMVMNPDIVSKWFDINELHYKITNIIFGWLSPLNHATYYMHNFGYDNLPRLWESYVMFVLLSTVFFGLSMLKSRTYAFYFTGTEKL